MATIVFSPLGDGKSKKRHTPSAELPEQLRSRRGEHPGECAYAENDFDTPDFGVMTPEQQRYYLHYRDSFLAGGNPKGDQGYVWLLLTDLANTREDPERVMSDMERLRDACVKDWSLPAPVVFTEVMAWYALANDLDMPRDLHDDHLYHRIMVSELLSPEVEEVPLSVADVLCGYPLESVDTAVCTEEALELFNAALPRVDSYLRDRNGEGIIGTYGEGEMTESVSIFSGGWSKVPYDGEKDITVTYISSGERLRTFLGAMLRYCAKVIAKDVYCEKGPSVSTVFDAGLRRIVDETYRKGDIVPPEFPVKKTRGSARGSADSPQDRPVYVKQDYVGRSISRNLRSDIERYADVEPSGKCEYVPSGSRTPEYGSMGVKGLNYYLYWRSMARKGRLLPADKGHLWLYQCELINRDLDPDFVLEQLGMLSEAYDKHMDRGFLSSSVLPGQTYIDYIIFNGLEVPPPYQAPCPVPSPFTSADTMDRLVNGEPVRCAVGNMLILGQIKDKTTIASFDDDCAGIAVEVLRRIEGELEKRKRTIKSVCKVRTKTLKVSVYDYLEFYGWPSDRRAMVKMTVTNYLENEFFSKEMNTLLKAVARAVRNRGKKSKADVFVFGVDAGDILSEEVGRWFSEKKARAEVRTGEIVLDSAKVEKAEHDLRSVTDMVGTEEPEPAGGDAGEETPEPESSGDPWSDLSSRLNKGQREYLRKAVAGTIRAVKLPMEESINALAMDTVGDTVVEDGRAVEEYLGELKDAIGE